MNAIIYDYNDLHRTIRVFSMVKGFQTFYQFRFIETGNDDYNPEAGMGRFRDLRRK